MAIEAKNVPKMLVNEAKGVVINPYGVQSSDSDRETGSGQQEKKYVVPIFRNCV